METLLIREPMKRTNGKSFNEPKLIDGMLVSWLLNYKVRRRGCKVREITI